MGMLIRRHRKDDANAKTEKVDTERYAAETEQKEEGQEVNDLSSRTVAELKEMAKAADIEGYSTMNKNELITALE